MNDEIDNKIKEEGNAWLYIIIAIILLLVITGKCSNIEESSIPSNTEISK